MYTNVLAVGDDEGRDMFASAVFLASVFYRFLRASVLLRVVVAWGSYRAPGNL